MRRGKQGERAEEIGLRSSQLEGNGAAVGVAKETGTVQAEGFNQMSSERGGCGQGGDDVPSTLRAARTGKIKSNDVETVAEGGHHRDHCVSAAHQTVHDDKRGLAGDGRSSFEIGEVNAVEG